MRNPRIERILKSIAITAATIGLIVGPMTGTSWAAGEPALVPPVVSNTDGTTITMTFDQALSGGLAIEFTVVVAGATLTPTTQYGLTVTGSTAVIGLVTPLRYLETATVAYTKGTLANAKGNKLVPSFGAQSVTNNVPQPPAAVPCTTPQNLVCYSNTSGTALRIKFDLPLQTGTAVRGEYVIAFNGVTLTGWTSAVDPTDATFLMFLQGAGDPVLAYGETVTVSYGGGAQTLIGTNGTSVAAFTSELANMVPAPVPPAVTAAATGLDGTSVTLTFDKALSAATVAASDFSVRVNGANDTVTAASSPSPYTSLTLSIAVAVKYGDTITVSYVPGSLRGTNTAAVASISNRSVTNEVAQVLPPAPSTTFTNDGGTRITVHFDKAIQDGSVSATDFAVVKTGGVPVTGFSASLLSGVPTDVILMWTSAQFIWSDSITVGYTKGTLQGINGLLVPSFGPVSVSNMVTKPAPALVDAAAARNGDTITVLFSSDLNPTTETGSFTVSDSGIVITVAQTTVSGSTVTLQLASALTTSTVTLQYTKGTLTGTNGVAVANFGPLTVRVNGAQVAPMLSGTPYSGLVGGTLFLVFDRQLTLGSETVTDFAVSVDSVQRLPGTYGVSLDASGTTVLIAMQTQLKYGETVTVVYNGGHLTGANGAAVAPFTTTVTNRVPAPAAPTVETATVDEDGSSLEFTFSSDLKAGTAQAGEFEVLVNSVALTPTTAYTVSTSGRTLYFILTNWLVFGDTVTAAYSGTHLYGANNVAVATWTARTVTNPVLPASPPKLDTITSSTGGSLINLTFDRNILHSSVVASQFTVVVGGQTLTATTEYSVNGGAVANGISITLQRWLHPGETATVAYLSGTMRGTNGALVDTFTATAVTNLVQPGTLILTPTPVIAGAAAVGSTLTAIPGTWDTGVALAYQWKRNGVAIDSATAITFTLTTANLGETITVSVTGSKQYYGSVTRTSVPTAAVGAVALVAPQGVSASAVSASAIAVAFATVANAVTYTVRVYSNSALTTLVDAPHAGFTGSPASIAGLTASSTYYVTVTAVGDGVNFGSSVESDDAAVTTNAAPAAPVSSGGGWSAPAPTLDAMQTTVAAGEGRITEGGNPVTANTSALDDLRRVMVQGSNWTTEVAVAGMSGTAVLVGADLAVHAHAGSTLTARGTGYRAGTEVRLYAMSDPILLATTTTDGTGAFVITAEISDAMALGSHTLQINGWTPSGYVRSTSLRLVVEEAPAIVTPVVVPPTAPVTTTQRVTTTVRFKAYSAKLGDAAKAQIDRLARQVKALVAHGYAVEMTVVNGYVQPERYTGNDISLSAARATSVAAALRYRGIATVIATHARGRAPQRTAAGRKAVTLITLSITK